MDNQLSKKIETLGNNFAAKSDHLSKARISKSDFDKTYIGTAIEKVDSDSGSYWLILTDGASYRVAADKCNITAVGQKVRLFVPNHRYQDKYAEVITEDKECISVDIYDDKLVFSYEDSTSDEVLFSKDSQGKITSFTYQDKTMEVNWHE